MAPTHPSLSRRDFLQLSSAVGAASLLPATLPAAHVAGRDTLRVGLIGCGGRGRGAVRDMINAQPGIEITALADLFDDRIQEALSELGKLGAAFKVDRAHCFTGFDAHLKLLQSGVDAVILATPPGFRPMQLRAAIDAGKHVFTEKPVAVDAPGVRSVLATAALADQKKLCVVAGTQRRHQAGYLEALKRVHDGAIGELVAGRCFWNQGSLWMKPRQPQWSDMEWQLRNWLYFTWLSGDHICEQHVHNLDVMNWALRGVPVRATALAGREVRKDPAYGNVFDHFAVDYEYPGGVHIISMCRQIDGCANEVAEHVVGTKGRGWFSSDSWEIRAGQVWRQTNEGQRNPYVQEQDDLVTAIRSGRHINELRTVAEATMTAILGRMSAYTGRALTWDQALKSEQDLMPRKLELGPIDVPPIAVPGQTPFV